MPQLHPETGPYGRRVIAVTTPMTSQAEHGFKTEKSIFCYCGYLGIKKCDFCLGLKTEENEKENIEAGGRPWAKYTNPKAIVLVECSDWRDSKKYFSTEKGQRAIRKGKIGKWNGPDASAESRKP